MKRLGSIFTVLAAVVMLAFSSCKETEEFDDHANWKKRNADFISDRMANTSSLISLFQPIRRAPISAMPSKVEEEEWLHTLSSPSALP